MSQSTRPTLANGIPSDSLSLIEALEQAYGNPQIKIDDLASEQGRIDAAGKLAIRDLVSQLKVLQTRQRKGTTT